MSQSGTLNNHGMETHGFIFLAHFCPKLRVCLFACTKVICCKNLNLETYFEQLYGSETTDRYRPSVLNSEVSIECQEADKQNQTVLKAGKVRGFVTCCECGKPRCVYRMNRLNLSQVCIVL